MPKFEVTIVKTVPSHRQRAVILVEAETADDVEENLSLPDDVDLIEEDSELEWEEIMEGHGGFPCDYELYAVDCVETEEKADLDLRNKD